MYSALGLSLGAGRARLRLLHGEPLGDGADRAACSSPWRRRCSAPSSWRCRRGCRRASPRSAARASAAPSSWAWWAASSPRPAPVRCWPSVLATWPPPARWRSAPACCSPTRSAWASCSSSSPRSRWRCPSRARWMETVKSVFGVVMLVAALYFLRNVVGTAARIRQPLGAASSPAGAVSSRGGAGAHLSFHGAGAGCARRLGVLALVVAGGFGGIGAVLAGRPAQAAELALEPRRRDGRWRRRAPASSPALLDFYADWCLPCKELELKTFSSPRWRACCQRSRARQGRLHPRRRPGGGGGQAEIPGRDAADAGTVARGRQRGAQDRPLRQDPTSCSSFSTTAPDTNASPRLPVAAPRRLPCS